MLEVILTGLVCALMVVAVMAVVRKTEEPKIDVRVRESATRWCVTCRRETKQSRVQGDVLWFCTAGEHSTT